MLKQKFILCVLPLWEVAIALISSFSKFLLKLLLLTIHII
ncbi:hypothetical protein FM107_10515 [Sphingobacterium sp. JB170]|nr:hypothetical protein FM107_10515 [Sphingobacterium sp. JB170]